MAGSRELLDSLKPGMHLDKNFFLKVYGHEITRPGFAENVIKRLINFLSPSNPEFVNLNLNGELLKDFIADYKPGLVILDPIQSFIPEKLRMGDRNAMRKCFTPLLGYGETYKPRDDV